MDLREKLLLRRRRLVEVVDRLVLEVVMEVDWLVLVPELEVHNSMNRA